MLRMGLLVGSNSFTGSAIKPYFSRQLQKPLTQDVVQFGKNNYLEDEEDLDPIHRLGFGEDFEEKASEYWGFVFKKRPKRPELKTNKPGSWSLFEPPGWVKRLRIKQRKKTQLSLNLNAEKTTPIKNTGFVKKTRTPKKQKPTNPKQITLF